MKLVMARSVLILVFLTSTLLVLPAVGRAQDDPRRVQIEAATERAVDRLRADIGAARITPNLTVDDFLRRTASSDELRKVLQESQQIGGPRWIDDQTCQVQLESSGDTVAAALVSIARAKPDRSPLPAEVLAHELRGWKSRSFAATGESMTAERVQVVRPVRVGAWNAIGDDIRRQAVAAAREDAVRRALDSVRTIGISNGQTIDDVLARPAVSRQMKQWFESRPVKMITYTEQLQVDLTLSAPADEAFDALLNAMQRAGDVRLPQDEAGLTRLRTEFVQRMASPDGRATVSRPAGNAAPGQSLELPPQPPDWITRQLDADGATRPAGKPLATQRVAQDRAMDSLRSQIGKLALTDELTIDQASKIDPRIDEAVNRALVRARVFKVEYDSDGSVHVRMTLDARVVWDEIANGR